MIKKIAIVNLRYFLVIVNKNKLKYTKHLLLLYLRLFCSVYDDGGVRIYNMLCPTGWSGGRDI